MTRPIQVALKRYASGPSDQPGPLSAEQVADRGNVAGFCDAALDRPSSAAIRFCEERLQYDCMEPYRARREQG